MARKRGGAFEGSWQPNAHYESGAKFEEKLIFYDIYDKNLVNFDLSTKKSKKNCTFIGPFCVKYTKSDLKKYKGVYFMTLKSHAKSEKKLTCGLENEFRNLANFLQNTWKCQNWYFHGILLFKVENVWATNYMSYRGVISNGTEEWWKNLKRNWLVISK